MVPDELSDEEKWLCFHAAMEREKGYVALQAATERRREITRKFMFWTAVFLIVTVFIIIFGNELSRPLHL